MGVIHTFSPQIQSFTDIITAGCHNINRILKKVKIFAKKCLHFSANSAIISKRLRRRCNVIYLRIGGAVEWQSVIIVARA
jgi:hypothetical protein